MITFVQKGDFSNLTRFLERAKNSVHLGMLDKYGREGVAALAAATPVDTGVTANSWGYEIVRKNGAVSIVFKNSNIQNGVPIAIILQYGHATGTGGYVQGRDYINPAIQPIFDRIADEAWKEVIKS
nr:MAG TPA: type I neck protein [Caudoviricetes sp.]